MSRYIHKFETIAAYTAERNSNYIEPWTSYTVEGGSINYNMSEEQKMLITPLTFEVLTDGAISFRSNSNSTFEKSVEYKKNNEEWTTITSLYSSDSKINVVAGDTVQFRGDNSTYYSNYSYVTFAGTTCNFNLSGNILSLVSSTSFGSITALTGSSTFREMFRSCATLISAENLIVPNITLSSYCFYCTFRECTNLIKGPALMPLTLASGCYYGIFWDSTNLIYAKCLATDTSASNCISNMFQGFGSASTGTFVKNKNLATWPGWLPANWTVVDA